MAAPPVAEPAVPVLVVVVVVPVVVVPVVVVVLVVLGVLVSGVFVIPEDGPVDTFGLPLLAHSAALPEQVPGLPPPPPQAVSATAQSTAGKMSARIRSCMLASRDDYGSHWRAASPMPSFRAQGGCL
jgi:hypothetical protein